VSGCTSGARGWFLANVRDFQTRVKRAKATPKRARRHTSSAPQAPPMQQAPRALATRGTAAPFGAADAEVRARRSRSWSGSAPKTRFALAARRRYSTRGIAGARSAGVARRESANSAFCRCGPLGEGDVFERARGQSQGSSLHRVWEYLASFFSQSLHISPPSNPQSTFPPKLNSSSYLTVPQPFELDPSSPPPSSLTPNLAPFNHSFFPPHIHPSPRPSFVPFPPRLLPTHPPTTPQFKQASCTSFSPRS
jgi:hypothetical protein